MNPLDALLVLLLADACVPFVAPCRSAIEKHLLLKSFGDAVVLTLARLGDPRFLKADHFRPAAVALLVVLRTAVGVVRPDLALEQPFELGIPIDGSAEKRFDKCELFIDDENVVL